MLKLEVLYNSKTWYHVLNRQTGVSFNICVSFSYLRIKINIKLLFQYTHT